MGEGIIPAQIKGETRKAYAALIDYCQMGPGRSLQKLRQEYVRGTSKKHHLRTLQHWSATHHWQERVAEYERRAAEQREQERQRQRIEAESRVVDDSLSMLEWWEQRKGQYHESDKAVPTMSYRELVKMRKEIDDLMRRSLGLPDRATESTVRGPGKEGEHIIRVEWTDESDS